MLPGHSATSGRNDRPYAIPGLRSSNEEQSKLLGRRDGG